MKANETQLRQTFSAVQINRGQTKHSARNGIQMDGRASGRLPARDENFLVGLERVMGSCCRTAESQDGPVPSSAKDGRCVICERAGVGEPRRLQLSGDSHKVACCTSVVSLSC